MTTMTSGPNEPILPDDAIDTLETPVPAQDEVDVDHLAAARALLGEEDAAPEDMGAMLIAKLQAAQEEIATLKDAGLRALAENENVRRRAEKEKTEARLYAIDKFARDLLSVADNLGRAITTAPEAFKGDAAFDGYVTGVEMTERELQGAFERHGLKRVGAKGDKFDPAIHQAVAQVPSDVPAGEIAEVFQPGYVLAGRTIRAAMVAVSAGAAAPPPA
jgi:molecular chaperone GrpE